MIFKKGVIHILAAFVGGKNTKIAIMTVKNKRSFEILFSVDHLTRKIHDFSDSINNILEMAKENYGVKPILGCVAAAGPVSRKRGYIRLTNTDLEIEKTKLLAKTPLKKIFLLNDYEAIGYGIDFLNKSTDMILFPHVGEDLTAGKSNQNTIAVIGAENELGMTIAQYIPIKDLHMAIPSEGGHMDFAPYNDFEAKFVKYLQKKVMSRKDVQPEYERVLSAKGMENIFDYVVGLKGHKQNSIVRKIKKLSGLEKRSAIGENYHRNKACKLTIDTFMSFYARASRNLALMCEPYSGLFLADVIALRYLKREKDKSRMLVRFMTEYELHDKRSDVLRKVPVYMISNKKAGLYGCCNAVVNFLI